MQKKWLGLISCSLIFGLTVPTVCFAREKIEEISLNFSADLDSGAEWPDMEISGDEEGYSVDNFRFQPDSSKKYPEGVVTLLADDEHYFGNIKASNCDLEGEGAIFVKAVKKTSSQLNLTVSFREMGVDVLDNPEGLTWNQSGLASWEPISGAKHYEVRLMRDGRTEETASQPRPNTPGRWIPENGDWYFFHPGSDDTIGKLYTNSVTPDGSSVNKDGAWIVNGVVQTQ